jgi:hypothetical protein
MAERPKKTRESGFALALRLLERDRTAFFDCHTVRSDPDTLSRPERAVIKEYDRAIRHLRFVVDHLGAEA